MEPPPAYSHTVQNTPSFQEIPLHSGPTLPVYTIRTTSSNVSAPSTPRYIYRTTTVRSISSTTSRKWMWAFRTSATSFALLFFAAFIVILIILLVRYAFR